MKRKQTINVDYQDMIQQAKSMFNLSQDEINEIIVEVKKFDTKGTGYVGKHEVDDVLRDLKLLDNEKLIAKFNEELKIMNAKFLDFKQVCDLYCKLKQYQYNRIVGVFDYNNQTKKKPSLKNTLMHSVPWGVNLINQDLYQNLQLLKRQKGNLNQIQNWIQSQVIFMEPNWISMSFVSCLRMLEMMVNHLLLYQFDLAIECVFIKKKSE